VISVEKGQETERQPEP